MVDAIDADVVEALANVRERVLLVDVTVHRQPVARGARAAEHFGELHRRIVLLVGVQPDADDPML